MPRRPRIQGRELIRALGRAGFQVLRTRGSHHYLHHPDGRTTVIPVHSGEEIGIGLLGKILRDVEWTNEDLLRHL